MIIDQGRILTLFTKFGRAQGGPVPRPARADVPEMACTSTPAR